MVHGPRTAPQTSLYIFLGRPERIAHFEEDHRPERTIKTNYEEYDKLHAMIKTMAHINRPSLPLGIPS